MNILRNNPLAQQAQIQSQQMNSQNFEKFFEVFIDAFSGATGGLIAQLFLYPIENVRTRL